MAGTIRVAVVIILENGVPFKLGYPTVTGWHGG